MVPRNRRAKSQPESGLEITATNIVIAKRGDVIFQLGDPDGELTKVKVSSESMGFVSRVFEIMFNGEWADGQAFSPDNPREVPLPNDDEVAMLLLCRIAHFQISELPEYLDLDDLTVFAVTCDKYRCTGAVQTWSLKWTNRILKKVSSPEEDCDSLLFATYLLDLPEEFYQTTVYLARVPSKDVTLANLDLDLDLDILPLGILDTLRINKRKSENRVYAAISRSAGSLSCHAGQMAQGRLLHALSKRDVWPIRQQSVAQLKDKIARIGEVLPPRGCLYPSQCQCDEFKDIKRDLVEQIDIIYKSVPGICLDCYKRRLYNDPTRSCRMGHNHTAAVDTG
jgi:hypothetical protein